MSAGANLFRAAAETLREHSRRIAVAATTLPPEDLWWRPHPDVLAFGNVLAHLEGNVRQWILGGIGGACDHRDRSAEFDRREGEDLVLLAALAGTVEEAACLIEGLPGDEADRPRTIQGFETTTQGAVLHVVEHFAWHAGQAVWIAKARAGAGHGLAFYDDAALDGLTND